MSTRFDIFTIRQWRQGYTLEVGISRPSNAPRGKFTKADRARAHAANKKNLELHMREPVTLEEIFEEIKRLQIPEIDDEAKSE